MVIGALLAAAGAHVLLFSPYVDAFLAEKLVLAPVALQRFPVLGDNLNANRASDHLAHAPDLLGLYKTLFDVFGSLLYHLL